jgi:lipopolysaccharide/colanic/teichoic acid biosynthesis glycosyltransferase
MMSKRLLDILASSLGLLLLALPFLLLAVWIKIDSSGPVFFRQVRVGRYGRQFRIHKFRTMVIDAEKKGLQITVGEDRRVTRVGKWMRKYKLDELPQLINVWLGSMSLVGPRPEVPEYTKCYPSDIYEVVLSVRPGITDLASIEFKDENVMLGRSADPQTTYVEVVLPIKLEYYVKYVQSRTLWNDICIILKTLFEIVRNR